MEVAKRKSREFERLEGERNAWEIFYMIEKKSQLRNREAQGAMVDFYA